MLNIKEFNLDMEDALDEEASEGFCTKWKKRVSVQGQPKTIWIKASGFIWGGYEHESLGEVVASQVAADLQIRDVVQYKPCILNITEQNGRRRRTLGCYSYDFTQQDEEVVSILNLYNGLCYGTLDYDPYFFFRDEYEELDEEKDSRLKLEKSKHFHDFDIIENLEQGFYREYLGSFHKGTNSGHDEGMEVIWSRYDGSEESLEYMGITQEDKDFWEHKKSTRKKWLYINEKLISIFEEVIVMALSNNDEEKKSQAKKEFIEDCIKEYEKLLTEERPH